MHPEMAYDHWIALREAPDIAKLKNPHNEVRHWEHRPVLSIVMPVFNPPFGSACCSSSVHPATDL